MWGGGEGGIGELEGVAIRGLYGVHEGYMGSMREPYGDHRGAIGITPYSPI